MDSGIGDACFPADLCSVFLHTLIPLQSAQPSLQIFHTSLPHPRSSYPPLPSTFPSQYLGRRQQALQLHVGPAGRKPRNSHRIPHLSPATKFRETQTSVAPSAPARISQLAQKIGQVAKQIDTQCNHISVGNQPNLKPILPFILIIIFRLHRYSF